MLTQLCNDLKFRHEEDVEELNSEIEMLKSILKESNIELANHQFLQGKFEHEKKDWENERQELLEKIGELREISNQVSQESSFVSPDQRREELELLLDSQAENDKLKWKIASL